VFVKGQSGNPAGRRPGNSLRGRVRQLARECSLDAFKELRAWMQDPQLPIDIRMRAAERILERGAELAPTMPEDAADAEVSMRQLSAAEIDAHERALLPEVTNGQA
jgi:hypothetical protein